MRDAFWNKIAEEYQLYKRRVLWKEKEEIYGNSYEIEMRININQILIELGERLSEEVLAVLLSEENLLDVFYQTWLKKEDSLYKELEHHVVGEIMSIVEKKENGKKGVVEYGTNKAA